MTPFRRLLIPAFASLLFSAAPALAQSGLAQPLSQARAEGCDGRAGVDAPLREKPALSEAARRIADGMPLSRAMRESGYRANRSVRISLGGYRSVPDIVDAVRDNYCQALINPDFTELGVYREGNRISLVLADPFSPPEDAQATSKRVLELVNQARSQPRRCGSERFAAAAPLELDPALRRAAQAHASDMAKHSFMAHEGSQGSTVGERVSQAGYAWRAVGENVAQGPQTAQAVVQGWLDSPGHCVNIMNPRFTQMGVAYAVKQDSEGGIYWAQVFAAPR